MKNRVVTRARAERQVLAAVEAAAVAGLVETGIED
jgi:hypothetical protein